MKLLLLILSCLGVMFLVGCSDLPPSSIPTPQKENNTMYINLQSHISTDGVVNYNMSDISDGLNMTNYTIQTAKGREWSNTGDII